jgi:WD40 repeat protein/uncharacterized caspase-like protein
MIVEQHAHGSYRQMALSATVLMCAVISCVMAVPACADSRKAEIVPQIGHAGAIQSIATSADGRLLISGSFDRSAKLWDADSGTLLRTLQGHTEPVSAVAFSPDGRFAITASHDKTTKLWEATSGQLVRTFSHSGEYDRVLSVAYSPDGRAVASGTLGGTLRVWEVTTGAVVQTMKVNGGISSLAFSSDGRHILSSDDKTLRLWNATTGALIRSFSGHSENVHAVAISRDGSRLASGGSDHSVKIWDARTGQLVFTLVEQEPGNATIKGSMEHARRRVHSVAISPDGSRVASGSLDTTIKLWDISTGKLLRKSTPSSGMAATFSSDGNFIFTGGTDEKVRRWDARDLRLTKTFEGMSQLRAESIFTAEGAKVLSLMGRRLIRWDITSGRLAQAVDFDYEGNLLAVSPDGASLLIRGGDTAALWDVGSGKILKEFKGHSTGAGFSGFWSASFSADGRLMLSGGYDKTAVLWDVGSGRAIRSFDGHSAGERFFDAAQVALSQDSMRVAVGGFKTARIFETTTGRLLHTLIGHTGGIRAVAFSHDGAKLVTAGDDATARIWDPHSGKLLRTLQGHSGQISFVTFSRDGARILTASVDTTIKLWDGRSGLLIRNFGGHSAQVRFASFAADEKRIVTSSLDGTTGIWELATGQRIVTFATGARDEWLAMTSSGFFTGSGTGGQLLQVVRGFDATSTDQVHQSLFNPDLVRAALAGDPEDEVRSAAEFINLDKVLDSGPPPSVTITSPVDGSQSQSDVATMQVRVVDRGKGIGRIEWRVNGVTAAVGSGSSLAQQLALDPGENLIEVVAYNASNLLASPPARTTIKFTAPAGQTRPNLYVLAIGINAYKDRGAKGHPGSTFAELVLAKRDAETFASDMARAAAGQYGQVKVITALDAEATKDNLGKLIDRIAREVHPRDTFILFAAAHGYSIDGRYYLIPQDYDGGVDPAALAQHAIDQGMLQDWLGNRIKARKAVVLLDTCESGALIAGHSRARTDIASEAVIGRLHEATGRPVLAASALGQYAYEDSENKLGVKHGLFTWAVLQALRHGDTNGNKLIELSELVAYVQDQVPKLAAQLGGVGMTKSAMGGATTTSDVKQQARIGSRGEDFVLTRRLQ